MSQIIFLSDIVKKTKIFNEMLESYSILVEGNIDYWNCLKMTNMILSILIEYMRIKKFAFDVYDYNLDEMNSIRMKSKFLCSILMMKMSYFRLGLNE